MDDLTSSQRNRILEPHNTPWHTLTYFGETYAKLYDDPGSFKPSYAPSGFRGPIIRIKDIPDQKGNYAFIGRILRVQKRDGNDETRVAKRDGKKYTEHTFFINVYMEDDTGEVGCTINRFKAADYEWLCDQVTEGRDFFIRGNIIGEGRKWIFVDKLVELEHDNKSADDKRGA